MKKLLFFVATLLTVVPMFAIRQATVPEFESGYIKMATHGGLCGGVTFIPKPGFNVRIMALRFAESLFGAKVKPGKALSNWVEVPVGGLRVAYDWAGPRASFHYRVYCQAMNVYGSWQSVDCAQVIDIDDVQHNRPCIFGPLGPSASYAPLNMKIKK